MSLPSFHMTHGSGSSEVVCGALQTLHEVGQTEGFSFAYVLIKIYNQESCSTTSRLFSPKFVPDDCFARQHLHFHFVAFFGLSFRNGIAPNMSSVSVYEEIMRLAEVRIYYQACVFLSSHRIPVLKFMAESLNKSIA